MKIRFIGGVYDGEYKTVEVIEEMLFSTVAYIEKVKNSFYVCLYDIDYDKCIATYNHEMSKWQK